MFVTEITSKTNTSALKKCPYLIKIWFGNFRSLSKFLEPYTNRKVELRQDTSFIFRKIGSTKHVKNGFSKKKPNLQKKILLNPAKLGTWE